MKFKRFLRHIAISVNPTKYRQVKDKTFAQTLGLYFFVWAIVLVYLLIIGLVQFSLFVDTLSALGSQSIDMGPAPSKLLVPGLVLVFGLVLFISTHLITLLSAVIIKLSIKKAITFRDAWILCLHAILVPMLLFSIVLVFTDLFFWLFMVLFFFYAIFVAIGTALLGGKQFKSIPSKESFKDE